MAKFADDAWTNLKVEDLAPELQELIAAAVAADNAAKAVHAKLTAAMVELARTNELITPAQTLRISTFYVEHTHKGLERDNLIGYVVADLPKAKQVSAKPKVFGSASAFAPIYKADAKGKPNAKPTLVPAAKPAKTA